MAQNDDSTMDITNDPSSAVSNLSDLGVGATVNVAEPVSHSNHNETGGSETDDGNNNNDGPEAENEANTEGSPRAEANSNAEDRIIPEEALEMIKRQNTHHLFCPICSTQITTTAVLLPNGQKPPPKNVVWVPISLKLPPISFPSFPTLPFPPFLPNPVETIVPTDPSYPPVEPIIPNPTPVPELVPRPDHVPRHQPQEPVPSSCQKYTRFMLFVVLLLLLVIVLWVTQPNEPFSPPPPHVLETNNTGPHSPSQVDVNGNSPPSPLKNNNTVPASPPTNRKRSPFSWSWVISFPSLRFLAILLVLFLAVTALGGFPSLPTWGSFTMRLPSIPFRIRDPAQLRHFLREDVLFPLRNLLITEPDILKSIVYGGLIESITSLGVVSSAAASGASTLNVLALGLANLSSGLFLIIHSLYGLLMSPLRNPDPYQDQLGDRNKSRRHCIVVIISFIFFGVIPPLFYGLSFQKTDKGHYKALVVLVASLVCVISLSFAKAKAFLMPNKLRTVAEYTGMAIGASALSFIASHIVADLFEKVWLS